jgi:integrase
METEERRSQKITFNQYLEANPNISESTSKVYEGVVRLFCEKYKEPTMKNVNEFLVKNYSNKRNYPYRYALRHYFAYLDREKEFNANVVKVKRKTARLRPAVYLKKTQLLDVIGNIEEDMLKLVALMQMYTGCRCYEILNLKWKDIRTDRAIHIVETKTDKARAVRVPDHVLDKVLKMRKQDADAEEYIFWNGKILKRSLYRRYLYKLQKATGYVLGKSVRMGTHDFRRNFARAAQEFYKNPLEVQRAGHRQEEACGGDLWTRRNG